MRRNREENVTVRVDKNSDILLIYYDKVVFIVMHSTGWVCRNETVGHVEYDEKVSKSPASLLTILVNWHSVSPAVSMTKCGDFLLLPRAEVLGCASSRAAAKVHREKKQNCA